MRESCAEIECIVYGVPVPKGSTRGFVVKGKPVITAANPKTKDWQRLIAMAAQKYRPELLHDGAVELYLKFYFLRPKSVSVKKRPYHTVRPDLDKLTRTACDALKGVIYSDDSRVDKIVQEKHYGNPPRIEVKIRLIEEG